MTDHKDAKVAIVTGGARRIGQMGVTVASLVSFEGD